MEGRRVYARVSGIVAVLLAAVLLSAAAPPPRRGIVALGGFQRLPYAAACTGFYPLEAQRLGEQGAATVGYSIAADGTLQGLTILRSSGFADLDHALLDCAAGWHVPAILKDGAAVLSAGHQATIRFTLSVPLPPELVAEIAAQPQVAWAGDPSVTPSFGIGNTHNCAGFFPGGAHGSGDIHVGYDVDIDGTISHVVLLKTSGDGALDDAALDCVRTAWRNAPALKDGAPVASPGIQAIVRFTIH
jgi:TonB family protein